MDFRFKLPEIEGDYPVIADIFSEATVRNTSKGIEIKGAHGDIKHIIERMDGAFGVNFVNKGTREEPVLEALKL